MDHRFRIKNCFVFACLFSISLAAQTPSLYQLELRKDFISWVWSANLQTSIKTGEQSQVILGNQFQSSLFRQSSVDDKWRDENTFSLYWQNPLNNRFETRSIVESRIFSDENTSRKFNKHLVAQELSVNLNPNVKFKPALGLALEESFNNADQGWYARAGLEVSKLNMGDYLNYTDVSSVIHAFPGRKNQDHTFMTGWTRRFSDQASDSLRLGYQFSESRYFIQPTEAELNPQERVIQNARFLFNQLQYRVSNTSQMVFITNFKDRDIDQTNPFNNRRRKEFSLENQLQYLMFLGPFQIQNGIFFSQARYENPGVETDVNTLQSALNTAVRYQPGKKDVLWGKFSYTKLEYNTPNIDEGAGGSSLNKRQDRDEQRFIIDAAYQHRFNPYFLAKLHGNVYLYHQIYLRSGRSQNNNWNRIFQLAAQFKHRISAKVSHNNQLKILSNFTVFDFEEFLPTVRSFVFRKLIYSDSLSLDLTGNLSLNNIYQLEIEDTGTFFKKEFAQQISRELTAHFININLEHKNILGLRITSGITYFLRDEWGFTPLQERRKIRKFRSVTPRLTVVFPASKRLLLYVNYAPNRSENFTRPISADQFQENIQNFTSGNVKIRYTF